MEITIKNVVLKDGRTAILRSPCAADAREMIGFLRDTAGETTFLSKYPEEITYTEEGEVGVLEKYRTSPRDVMICVEMDGRIMGNCNLSGGGTLRSSHRAELGIALRHEIWGQGTGSALFDALLDCARQAGYEQLYLWVVSENRRGLGLYEKYGFTVCGRRPRGQRYRDGTYADELLMVREL